MGTRVAAPRLLDLPPPTRGVDRFWRDHGWELSILLLLLILLAWRYTQLPQFSGFELRTITAGTMALVFIAMAQGVIVIGGGIDLSVGAMMVLINCLTARWMAGQGLEASLLICLLAIAVAAVISAAIGCIVVASGIPDIVVTLAASFILSGAALLVLNGPGGGANASFQSMVVGGFSEPLPSILWTVAFLVLFWIPIKRSRLGVAIYAVGSSRQSAFLAGVDVRAARIASYAIAGVFSALAGIVTTAFTGSGEPRASIGAGATLASVAAVVVGGVALSGGKGSLLGPALAAMCLTLIPGIMLGLGVDPNLAEVARGVIIIGVVMVGGLVSAKSKLP